MKNRFALLFLLPLLAACQGNEVRNALGLEREAPDEFVVYSRPPLSLPPEFELHPPRPGEPALQQTDSRTKAQNALFGENAEEEGVEVKQPTGLKPATGETAVTPVIASDAKSAAESSFLNRSGAFKADPEIREKLIKSTGPNTDNAKSLFDKIIKSEGQEPVVDATKEAERLRTNKQQGKPVTEGETPTIDPSPKTVIDKLF